MNLGIDFYERENVVQISRELIGKVLCVSENDQTVKAIITETEAYEGVTDKASHAYGGRRTERTEIMFEPAGRSYVYLCYGVHSLFNVVTNKEGIPHAVLIRGVYPISRLDIIQANRNSKEPTHRIANGPGKLTKALGIHFREHNDLSLLEKTIWIEDQGLQVLDSEIQVGPRIGIDYAEEDALLPYRFLHKDPQGRFGKS
jgi:DNA-3-methyladenine glycosylase